LYHAGPIPGPFSQWPIKGFTEGINSRELLQEISEQQEQGSSPACSARTAVCAARDHGAELAFGARFAQLGHRQPQEQGSLCKQQEQGSLCKHQEQGSSCTFTQLGNRLFKQAVACFVDQVPIEGFTAGSTTELGSTSGNE